MVDNWNYALQYATGDYVFFFTDKMFLLPGTLAYAADVLKSHPAEIINWVDNKFIPIRFPNYFDEGHYVCSAPGVAPNVRFEEFDPRGELRKKALAGVSRGEQSASHYARGKICFGGYARSLIRRVLDRAGKLFHNISPDYTSMIFGLSYAKSAIEIGRPGIVHINTDLSNGGQAAIRDDHALSYLESLCEGDSFLDDMLVPELYSSAHNCVARDYIALQRKFELDYRLSSVNWLVYITEDLNLPARVWSSPSVELAQRKLLAQYIGKELDWLERLRYYYKVGMRSSTIKGLEWAAINRKAKHALRPLIPRLLLAQWRRKQAREQQMSPTPKIIHLNDLLVSLVS